MNQNVHCSITNENGHNLIYQDGIINYNLIYQDGIINYMILLIIKNTLRYLIWKGPKIY